MMNFLFSPYGRISRKAYWLNWILPYFLISIGVTALDYILFPVNPGTGEPMPVFQLLATIVLFWPSIAVTTKRLHDRGMTGWWQAAPAVAVIPLAIAAYWYYSARMQTGEAAGAGTNLAVIDPTVSAVVTIVVGSIVAWVILYPLINVLFLRGQDGPNKYGEDPLGVPLADTFT